MVILGSQLLPRYSTPSQAPTTVTQPLEAKRRFCILVLARIALVKISLTRSPLAVFAEEME